MMLRWFRLQTSGGIVVAKHSAVWLWVDGGVLPYSTHKMQVSRVTNDKTRRSSQSVECGGKEIAVCKGLGKRGWERENSSQENEINFFTHQLIRIYLLVLLLPPTTTTQPPVHPTPGNITQPGIVVALLQLLLQLLFLLLLQSLLELAY